VFGRGTILDEFASLFRAMLQGAKTLTDPDIGHMILVTSWNEWHEDTQIEPVEAAPPTSVDDSFTGNDYTNGLAYEGYDTRYLDILREETFPVEYHHFTLTAPDGGEIIPSGSTYTIKWIAPPDVVSFNLKYSLNNGRKWKVIAEGLTGNDHGWTVPTPRKNKKKCLVKVIGYDDSDAKVGADTSDAPFTIALVEVTSPSEGETLISEIPYTIEWDTYGTKRPVEKVKLLYTKNGGRTWNKIETLEGDPGFYDWLVPDVAKTKSKCLVKVVLKDANGKTVGSDTSDGYFTIQPQP
jgi:hypothetical protein